MNPAGRSARIRVLVGEHAARRGARLSIADVCGAAVASLPIQGAGVSAMSSATASHPLCSTDEVSEQLEELQLTLGEGPCMDACARGTAVLALDLSTSALDLYAETPGDLGPGQFADAVAFADTAALLLLASHPAGREELFPSAVGCSPDLRALDLTSEDLGGYRAEIEATGVLAEPLGSGVDEAFLRLRAHAYTHGRRLAEVARDVVARTLRFRPDPAHVRPHDLEQPDDGS